MENILEEGFIEAIEGVFGTYQMMFNQWYLFIPTIVFIYLAVKSDLKEHRIYDKNNLYLATINTLLFVILPLFRGEWRLSAYHLVGGVFVFSALLIPAAIFLLSMGGDIKFSGGMGIALGPILGLAMLLLSCGLFVVHHYLFNRDRKYGKWIPFAPFMATSTGILVILGAILMYVI